MSSDSSNGKKKASMLWVWGALYRCLKAQGPAAPADRLDQVYTRLCRLDIGQKSFRSATGSQ